MYPHSPLWHYLWVAPHVLQVLVVIAMLRRRLVHQFPLFLAYTVFEILTNICLFTLDHATSVAPRTYWTMHAIFKVGSIALRFGVIYEIFSNVFDQYPALIQLCRMLLRWCAALLVLVAALVTAYAPTSDVPPIFSGIRLADLGISVVQTGLLLFLFMFSSYFRIAWRSYVCGIAAGVGIFSFVTVATAAIDMGTGVAPASYVLDFVTMIAYHCSVLVWLAYLLLPESQGRAAAALPNHDLEEWNQELQRLLLQ